jgi:hypothetical protein
VAVPDPVTLAGVMAPHVSPDGTVPLRLTVPTKWFTAVTVIVEFAEVPALTATREVTDIVKSLNWKRIVVEWFSAPLVPITVRV